MSPLAPPPAGPEIPPTATDPLPASLDANIPGLGDPRTPAPCECGSTRHGLADCLTFV